VVNWSNVKLILFREVRDQLRDRRTLFMIAVLPMVLYPLLGMSFLQIAQFMREEPTRVLVIGAQQIEGLPALVDGKHFAAGLFSEPKKIPLLTLETLVAEPAHGRDAASVAGDSVAARQAVSSGRYDAALYFPPDFTARLTAFREGIRRRAGAAGGGPRATAAQPAAPAAVPSPEVIFNTANDKSQMAYLRLADVLRHWTDQIGETNLAAGGVPVSAARPFDLAPADLAAPGGRRELAVWSKILPVLLLIWALTGAFYPAIDVCAGEKERGTLETLLSSPAERSEIVVGKLLTVMIFSALTALLNLLSIGMTGWLLLGKIADFGPPPPLAALWLLLALVPVAALFSALALALAAFARSTKEGQYYLMPLLLITMPLAVLPTAPGVELTLGSSLIPVTGVVLLLRCLLEGNYWPAIQFAAPVIAVTLCGCLLSIRWAVDQFNSESVLFRESERLEVSLWLRHLLRDREPTPTVAGAAFCGVVILLVRFFMSFGLPIPENFRSFAVLALITQLVVIFTPAVLMTVILTNSPRETLLLRLPRWPAIPAAVALAVALHPAARGVQAVVGRLYPLSEELKTTLGGFFRQTPNFWLTLLVIAVIPAVCEEIAFRGFILSGFRHLGHKWRAVIYSAVFFAATHTILQQSLIAALLGTVIGLLAIHSGSLLPGLIFHMLHNALALAASRITPQVLSDCPPLGRVMTLGADGDCTYRWGVVLAGVVISGLLLWWFQRIPYRKSAEEELQQAIDHGGG
jgi:sodium transport system permease protein